MSNKKEKYVEDISDILANFNEDDYEYMKKTGQKTENHKELEKRAENWLKKQEKK